jgi:outer membrane cobalamin receptor
MLFTSGAIAAAAMPGAPSLKLPPQRQASDAIARDTPAIVIWPRQSRQPDHGTPGRAALADALLGAGAVRAASAQAAAAQAGEIPAGESEEPAASAIEQAAAEPMDQGSGDAIIVPGTRTINRTVAESLSPIDVLRAGDLEASGRQSVRDLLGTLVPSINVSNNGAGASWAVRSLSLRGLGWDQLLVLVNGKRRHNTATLFINGATQNGQSPPDLDLIPGNAISRIEVLRDGASTQYGSDAIAGVVNVILRNDLVDPVSSLVLAAAAAAMGASGAQAQTVQGAPAEEGVRNEVLVHGAFVDGSGWRGAYEDLTARGYRVSIVQNPLTSLKDHVAATTRVLDIQSGPTILVRHSWGGR